MDPELSTKRETEIKLSAFLDNTENSDLPSCSSGVRDSILPLDPLMDAKTESEEDNESAEGNLKLTSISDSIKKEDSNDEVQRTEEIVVAESITFGIRYVDKKPFQCTECSKRFPYSSHLKIHMRIHTGEKPFACKVCNQCFPRTSQLNSHMKIHTAEKPFVCKMCNERFSFKCRLKSHMKTHTTHCTPVKF